MIKDYIIQKYGKYIDELDLLENRTSLKLDKIIINKEYRNNGFGSKILTDIINYADTNKQTVVLTPSDDFGSDKNKLIQYYKRFGFKLNQGYNADSNYSDKMIRYPKMAGMKENLKPMIKTLLREGLLKENYLDKALDNLSEIGDFNKLNDVDKLILLGASGDEEKTKKLNLRNIYSVNNSFGKRMVKIRVKPINQQPIDHKFSKEMAGEVGWLSPYIHYSDEMQPYNSITFDEMIHHNEHGDKSYKSLPIMLDNVYPINYGDEPIDFTKHDIQREIERIEFLNKFGMDQDDEQF